MIVLAIGDLHCPAEHPDAWDFLSYVKGRFKPDRIVCLGDEIDAAAMSRFTKNPDLPSAGDELERAIKHLQPMYKMFPKVSVCESNHTARPFRQAMEAGLPKAALRSYSEILRAPKGWEWSYAWDFDGMLYCHGDPYSGDAGTKRLVEFHGQSVTHGHFHAHAKAVPFPSRAGMVWGCNAGCLIDRHHDAFAYARGIHKPFIGVAIVEDGVPRLFPMRMHESGPKKGRWLGPKGGK